MTKPILWLGPLEELDADFDPLLGRSATQASPQIRPSTPKPALDPARSVFDDPLVETPDNAGLVPAAFDAKPPQSDANLNETSWPATQVNLEPALSPPYDVEVAVPTNVTDDAPPVHETIIASGVADIPIVGELAPEHVTETDFTHNNDPIPARQDGAVPVLDVSAHEPVGDFPAPVEQVVPKKSFFASLFSSRDNTPAETRDSASINDIWAKSSVEPDPEPEVAIEAESEVETKAEIVLDPPADTLPYAANTPLRGRNLWAEIDTKSDDELPIQITPTQSAPLTEADVDSVGEDNIAFEPVASSNVAVDLAETAAALPAAELEPAAEIVVDERTSEPDSIVAPELVEADLDEGEVEPAPQIFAQPDNTSPSPFKDAFNADQFWALARGTNPHKPETQGPETQGPEIQDPEIQDPDTQAPEPQDPIPAQASPDVHAGDELEVTQAPLLEALPEATAPPLTPSQQMPTPAIGAPKVRSGATGKRRKRKAKKNYVGAVLGTSLFMFALVMTFVSGIAAFGYPFDMISSYRWYWVILSVVAAGIFGLSRGWKMVAASFVLMGANLFVTVPATGKAPTGGNTATAVVGWANVSGNSDALARVFKDAQKKKATLLMLAEAPQSVFTPPAGWTLIEAPIAGDPTAIAVLSNSTWRAVTVPGEPTMARPAAGDLTIIALHPHDALKRKRTTPIRDAQINRAGTRAGYQEGPTVVLGDFNAAPWDSAIAQFRSYGNVTRVRCGGWAGSTLTQAFGLIGIATDHAFVRDVKVTHCQLGSPLTGGNHKPIWLYVAPQVPPLEAAPAP